MSHATHPDFKLEEDLLRSGCNSVCGVDEAGRGPWAGPVCAAAVILDPENLPDGLNDSKKLNALKRDELFEEIRRNHTISVTFADVERIDRDNILEATMWAMKDAISSLSPDPDHALIDGNKLPELPMSATAIVKGDGRSFSIAAASIVAKVFRDRLMEKLDHDFPEYGFAQHKGYGTRAHQEALKKFGPCPIHRKSFKPIAALIEAA